MHHTNTKNFDLKRPLSAAFYCTISLCLTFFNKFVLSVYHFPHSNVMLTIQMVVTLSVLWGLKKMRKIEYEDFSWNTARKTLPLATLYVLNVMFALWSLGKLNVPMYSVLKRTTTLVVLVMEYIFLNISSSKNVKISVLVTTFGAIIAGISDVSFDIVGYSAALMSTLLQGGYLILVGSGYGKKGLSTFGLLFYNNLISLPFLFVLTLVSGEMYAAITNPIIHDFDFGLVFWTGEIFAALLNYSIFYCTTQNSALTTTIMGHLKNIAATFIGWTIFDLKIGPMNATGLFINMFGSIWYSSLKYQENLSVDNRNDPPPDSNDGKSTLELGKIV